MEKPNSPSRPKTEGISGSQEEILPCGYRPSDHVHDSPSTEVIPKGTKLCEHCHRPESLHPPKEPFNEKHKNYQKGKQPIGAATGGEEGVAEKSETDIQLVKTDDLPDEGRGLADPEIKEAGGQKKDVVTAGKNEDEGEPAAALSNTASAVSLDAGSSTSDTTVSIADDYKDAEDDSGVEVAASPPTNVADPALDDVSDTSGVFSTGRSFVLLRRLSNTFPFSKDCLNVLDVTGMKDYEGHTGDQPVMMVTIGGVVTATPDEVKTQSRTAVHEEQPVSTSSTV